MKEVGENFSTSGPENHGFSSLNSVSWNLNQQEIYEIVLERGEGKLSKDGAMVVETGIHTGRSAQDKFVVKESANKDDIWWENAKEMSEDNFNTLYKDMTDFSINKDLFVQDLYGGADLQYRLPTRIYTEYAWHSLFIQNLLITVKDEEKSAFDPEFIIIDLPSFKADPNRHGSRSETIIAVNFAKKVVLIAGTSYAGEIKKSVFTMLNFLLPPKNVMPMHCSVNVGNENDSAIFFGLSGTGKTTLSADPKRTLIGDDEHGWSENGVFNFEGGCYAKMIRLSKDAEPEIYETTKKVGTILENVVLNEETGELDLDDDTLAENTRGAYPLSFIPNSSETGRGPIPKNIILLTCDAFGVLPPIAKLSASQTMYHFLSGYTAKENGFVKTLFGRKCIIDSSANRGPGGKAFMERAAINAPIQGTAADIIKRAMIKIPQVLKKENLSSKMIMQVHDELIFETKDDEIDKTIKIVRNEMSQAHKPVVNLSVDLEVEAASGKNWSQAH